MNSSLKSRLAKLEAVITPAPRREPGACMFAKDGQSNEECIAEYMAEHGLTERPKGQIVIFHGGTRDDP
jgi:hypothetical protein